MLQEQVLEKMLFKSIGCIKIMEMLFQNLRLQDSSPSGPRLKRHFRQADRDQNHRLNLQEAKRIPWISRNFNALDGDRDGSVTLEELWNHQRSLAPPQRLP